MRSCKILLYIVCNVFFFLLNNWLFIWCLDVTLVTFTSTNHDFLKKNFNSGFVAPYDKDHCDIHCMAKRLFDTFNTKLCCHYWSCGVCGTQIWYSLNNAPQTYIRHCLWSLITWITYKAVRQLLWAHCLWWNLLYLNQQIMMTIIK